MPIESLKSIFMPDYHHISISSQIFGYPHPAGKSRMYRFPGLQRDIDSLVTASPPYAEFTSIIYIPLIRAVVLAETVHKPDGPGIWEIFQR